MRFTATANTSNAGTYNPATRASTGQSASNYATDTVKSTEQTQTGNAVRGALPASDAPPAPREVASSGIGDDSAAVKAKRDTTT